VAHAPVGVLEEPIDELAHCEWEGRVCEREGRRRAPW
jgi:hypothetical protein